MSRNLHPDRDFHHIRRQCHICGFTEFFCPGRLIGRFHAGRCHLAAIGDDLSHIHDFLLRISRCHGLQFRGDGSDVDRIRPGIDPMAEVIHPAAASPDRRDPDGRIVKGPDRTFEPFLVPLVHPAVQDIISIPVLPEPLVESQHRIIIRDYAGQRKIPECGIMDAVFCFHFRRDRKSGIFLKSLFAVRIKRHQGQIPDFRVQQSAFYGRVAGVFLAPFPGFFCRNILYFRVCNIQRRRIRPSVPVQSPVRQFFQRLVRNK